MSELLIELLCEEIPSGMQIQAERSYLNIFIKYFQKQGIEFKKVNTFAGARRIVIHVNGLNQYLQGKSVLIKGPRIDSSLSTMTTFCNTNNLSKDKLIIQEVKGEKYYFYQKETTIQSIKLILFNSLADLILSYTWPKAMYWSDYKIKWVRPLRNILCIFNREIIPFKLEHLTANNVTYGHRYMSPKQIIVNDFVEYKKALSENFVMLDRLDRVKKIKTSLINKAKTLNLLINENDMALIEEVSGLVEYPVILKGSIEKKFLVLPTEVLVSSMRTHQKYFSLFDKERKFTPHFLFVSNIESSDPNIVIEGNEKVLSARLSDALYLYYQDLKKPLENELDNLAKVIFHSKLGSIKEKVERLTHLTKFIDVNSIAAIEASSICKSDTLLEVVGEFPHLRGIMGYHYAISNGKSKNIAIAIRNHYKPEGPNDSVPNSDAGILALADKVDSLCGLMMVGEKATSSKDPYGLRRLSLSIIRIIIENKLQRNVVEIVEFSCSLYKPLINYDTFEVYQIISFIKERTKNYLKDKFDYTQVTSVLNSTPDLNLFVIKLKLDALNIFLSNASGKKLLHSYKRATNIINSSKINGEINSILFKKEEERQLMKSLTSNSIYIDSLIESKNFLESFKTLSNMNQIIENFFKNVMIMDQNIEIAKNRLLILKKIRQTFNKVVDFDCL